MHEYLKAIGFGQINNRQQFMELVNTVVDSPDKMDMVKEDESTSYMYLSKQISESTGLAVCGEIDKDGRFQMEHHFPYLVNQESSTEAECNVERQSGKEAYNGIVDDYRLGMNLIFFVNNFMNYKKAKLRIGDWPRTKGVGLSALSREGKILMPIHKTPQQVESIRKENSKSARLAEAAKRGDMEAQEDLALRDMNLYSEVTQRAQKQDLYTIVDTFFMPTGVETDLYSIMGYILDFHIEKNLVTNEELILMSLECNEIRLKVCINRESLLGEPKVGYRFKGDIWLQGYGII